MSAVTYFSGENGAELNVLDITDDMPCGEYWSDISKDSLNQVKGCTILAELNTVELNARQFAEKLYELSPGQGFYFAKERTEPNEHNWIGVRCENEFGRCIYIFAQNDYGGFLMALCDEQPYEDDLIIQIQDIFNKFDMREYVSTVFAFEEDNAQQFLLERRMKRMRKTLNK
ncbi:MAG: hypothetical protein OSJ43_06685 [Oscillospiraceae bacterium]|nr:hypothetical protein [Oscillospiraceae bacterium]